MEEVTSPAANNQIRRSAARGALATMAGQGLRFVIQLASIVVLSRLLGPEVVGLFAVLMVLVALGEVLRDFGLSSAMIQAKEVTQAQVSNLFWINSAIGIGLGGLCVAVAPVVATFYRNDQLLATCAAVAAVFVFGGIGTQFRAQLTRDLRFIVISTIDVVAAVAGLAFAIAMALADFGLWAMVAQQIAIAAITTALNVALARWRPSWPTRRAGMRSFLIFGWHVGLIQVINTLAKNVDTMVVGRLFGAGALGIYSRAFQLMTVPLSQLSTPATKVAFPVLARIRDDSVLYNRYVLVGQRALVHLVGFVFVFTLAVAHPLIHIALGDEWSGVAPLYQILAVGALAQAASFATYWVFLSQGKTAENLHLTLVTRTALVVAVLAGAALGGVPGVAVAYSATIVVTWPFSLFWLKRVCADIPTVRMFWQPLALYLVYALAGVAAYLGSTLAEGALVSMLVAGAFYLMALATLLAAVRPYRRDVVEIAALRHLLGKRVKR